MSVLRLTDDGWMLEDDSGTVVDEGDYPLRRDNDFIERAAKALDNWSYHRRPYSLVDERSRNE